MHHRKATTTKLVQFSITESELVLLKFSHLKRIKTKHISSDEPSGSGPKHRPAPPPPLPPKTGLDQQRKSLTSKWLENKESSTSSSSSFENDDGTLDKKAYNQEKDQKSTMLFGLSKPYGEEMIDEQTRRSLETMSVVKEESEEDIEAEANVKLVRHKRIGEEWRGDDSGFVHRSDFLKVRF